MRRGLLLVALLAALAGTGSAATSHRPAPAAAILHVGDRGQRVRDLQFLLAGGRPSVYRRAVRTLPRSQVDGVYGLRTAAAVRHMRYRLGWKLPVSGSYAGRDLVQILEGKRKRPLGYLLRASYRLHEIGVVKAQAASEAVRCARRLIALERSQLGVAEQPGDGRYNTNRGPHISYPAAGSPYPSYQSSTGAYGLAWCASFQAWAYRFTHVGFPRAWDSYIAAGRGDAASVSRIVVNAHDRHWLRAQPTPGMLVAFPWSHVGLVETVGRRGIWSLEGNSGNAVREVYHPFDGRFLFVEIPGCAG